jgi:hypothetical protein
MAIDRYALKKELLQTRAAAERLELRMLVGRLGPGAARSARLQKYTRMARALRSNPLALTITGAILGRLPFGRFWGLLSRVAGLGWAGWQLYHVYEDFKRK